MSRALESFTIRRHGLTPLRAWGVALLVIAAVLALGAAFPPGEGYAELRKPTWQPPDAVFGPVWTLLYLMLAAALALLLQSPAGPARQCALLWFGLQLGLNAAWSPLFFGLERPALAFLAICLLWLALLASALAALRVRAAAGWLQLPCLAWVSFALVLNGVIVALNPA